MVGAAAKPPATPQPPPGNKPRPSTPQREPGAGGRKTGRPSALVRAIATILILWHLTAVFLAPMSIPPTSQLVVDIAQGRGMQWYLDALYINHGYYFFAPDPGAGRLVYFDVYDAQGNPVRQGKFPDWDVQWPRLWYHRHFMLADQVGLGLQSPQGPGEGERKYLRAYARQLLRQYGGESARVRWIEHQLLDPFRVNPNQPINLDAPDSYKLVLEVVQRRADLGPEEAEQTSQLSTERHDVATSGWTRATRRLLPRATIWPKFGRRGTISGSRP